MAPESVNDGPQAHGGGARQQGEPTRDGAGPDRLGPVLRQVRAGNGFEEALEQILQVVRLGLVPGGERLPPERELADRMGISRVTLREVLKVLQDQGLVESRRGRYGGTFVRPRPDTPASGAEAELRRRVAGVDIEDVLRFREVLETGAAGLCAAQGLDEEGAARLRGALAATEDAPLTEYRRLDTLLHLTLAELSGSATLTAQYAAVRATVNDLLDCIPLLVRNLEHSQRQHAALVDAILDRDPEAAREVMREHCCGTAALLRGFLT
ncbi:FadR/GntR family transcriptional regulator [Streptomyces sp. NRRL S-87]|uniref:FadR/GntR family transcriptional regulator n=1 Tax=Streptomyces sp. NRRL S-87 TaxID=1463920 RepID=UPI00099D7BA4|nr:FCD domain-containing protein [Streptomyces sp. NRRL S-87]